MTQESECKVQMIKDSAETWTENKAYEEISEEDNSLIRVPFSHHSEDSLEIYLEFRITQVQFKTLSLQLFRAMPVWVVSPGEVYKTICIRHSAWHLTGESLL